MSDTERRFTLPDALRLRVEAAAREEATTPEALIQAAVASFLEERAWQRQVERTLAYGQQRAAATGVTDETLDDEIHAFRLARRDQAERAR